ncbi:hypothetical protein ACFQ0B_40345 [Nonomuraea thailandensis]
MIMSGVLAAVALALVAGRGLFAGPADLYTLANTAAIAMGVLLPVLGILTVTGEWSHRTALTTFTLEPRRGGCWRPSACPCSARPCWRAWRPCWWRCR